MSGLRQLGNCLVFCIVAIEPQVVANDLLVPVGTLGPNHNRLPFWRQLDRGKAYGIKKIVECEFRLAFCERDRRSRKQRE